MESFKESIKKNKLKFLKIVIIVSSMFFILCSIFNLLEFSTKYFRTVVIFYLIIVSIAALISELSPYILYNYLVLSFPFLGHYLGRGFLYLTSGLLYITPEVGKLSNIAGYLYLGIGVLCLFTQYLINSANNKETDSNNHTYSKELKEKILFGK